MLVRSLDTKRFSCEEISSSSSIIASFIEELKSIDLDMIANTFY
jgi:hypothetical protein